MRMLIYFYYYIITKELIYICIYIKYIYNHFLQITNYIINLELPAKLEVFFIFYNNLRYIYQTFIMMNFS